MGRGLRFAAGKINSTPIGGVSAAEVPVFESSIGRSTPQRSRSSSQEAASPLQKGIHPEEAFLADARRTSHMQARPFPWCNFVHAWLLEVESKKINEPKQGPFLYAKGIEMAISLLWGETQNMPLRRVAALCGASSAIRDAD